MIKSLQWKVTAVLLLLLSAITIIQASENIYGVMSTESASEENKDFCIVYFAEFANLPNYESNAETDPVEIESSVDWCNEDPGANPKNKVVLLKPGECSIPQQAYNAQRRGAKATFFLVNSTSNVNLTDEVASEINITVGLISIHSGNSIREMKEPKVRLFSPMLDEIHLSFWIIWLIAVFNVAVGGWWSGHLRFAIYYNEMKGERQVLPNKPSVTTRHVHAEEKSSLPINCFFVFGCVAMMGLMLVVLYFFLDYIIYVILAMFFMASIIGVYMCFEPLFQRIPGECWRKFAVNNYCCRCNFDIRDLALLVIAISLATIWCVFRKDGNIWILQNFLGICFNIHMLKMIRLPNLKICTILLVLLFFYDIFFVFVTPFFTSAGDSIMERVATGATGGADLSGERVPMLFVVPQFSITRLKVCNIRSESMLGYGDILVPGLLVSYLHAFDLVTSKKKMYYLMSVISYGIGMLVTFLGLFLMQSAQPALLYLVPCTLIPTVLMGWCRGELGQLWTGFKGKAAAISPVDPEASSDLPNSTTDNSNSVATVQTTETSNSEDRSLLN